MAILGWLCQGWTCMHARTHARARTHAHTHTHTHICYFVIPKVICILHTICTWNTQLQMISLTIEPQCQQTQICHNLAPTTITCQLKKDIVFCYVYFISFNSTYLHYMFSIMHYDIRKVKIWPIL